ncbi:hypothetical protein F3Y22_tig00112249pilonHSYRG00074 [Hibiscus syriacus]|uniref:Uncharacterized protein n=1 Tax=Hibiscus syriacus TaxID=106335 RepID=A0A6A2YAQ0_HIBSY|nr:hypothetical protein F3Y22_tig00112249pilonHSYRG00074 [Hibiscus syriacus]
MDIFYKGCALSDIGYYLIRIFGSDIQISGSDPIFTDIVGHLLQSTSYILIDIVDHLIGSKPPVIGLYDCLQAKEGAGTQALLGSQKRFRKRHTK